MKPLLSAEDRQRIYEEEKVRRIARNQLQQEATQELLQSKVPPGILIFAIITIALGIVAVFAMNS